MTLEVTKESIDLGIITRDAGPMVAFYRDVVGLPFDGTVELPGFGTMHRLRAGSSVIKITQATPKGDAVPGGLAGATGLRYWTISVPDVDTVTEQVRAAGHAVVVEPRDSRPGVRIAIVADPDGNWLEFLTVAAA